MTPAARPPRISNPKAVPVVGTDHHLPGLPDDRMADQALRDRFPVDPLWRPEWPGDGRVMDRLAAPASVLIPLVSHVSGPTLLLTRRTDHLHDHPGQISFPGGKAEPGDADAVHTALREAREEIGLQPERVEILGTLPTYTTVTNFVVTPVVALVRTPLQLQLDAFEVAETFEVPLRFLMNPAHHRRHVFESDGVRRQFLSMPWSPSPKLGSDEGGREADAEFFIWGATAAMIRNLYRWLSHTPEPSLQPR